MLFLPRPPPRPQCLPYECGEREKIALEAPQMPLERFTQLITTAFTAGLQAFHKRSRTFGGFLSEVSFRMSTAETLVIPSSDRTLYGESAAPRKPSVVCLVSHQDISAYRGPGLHSRIPLRLLFLVLGARFVNELMDVHTHAYPGAVCQWTRQSLD